MPTEYHPSKSWRPSCRSSSDMTHSPMGFQLKPQNMVKLSMEKMQQKFRLDVCVCVRGFKVHSWLVNQ